MIRKRGYQIIREQGDRIGWEGELSGLCRLLCKRYGIPYGSLNVGAKTRYKLAQAILDNPDQALSNVESFPERATGKDAKAFYRSKEWARLRYEFLKNANRQCGCCGASDVKLVVDHIKPVRRFWDLRLDITNLQVLCDLCNRGKGSRDQTDWRRPA